MSTDQTGVADDGETLADANRRKLKYLEEQLEEKERKIARLESNINMLASEIGEEVEIDG